MPASYHDATSQFGDSHHHSLLTKTPKSPALPALERERERDGGRRVRRRRRQRRRPRRQDNAVGGGHLPRGRDVRAHLRVRRRDIRCVFRLLSLSSVRKGLVIDLRPLVFRMR
ncbi:hypothetical protein BT93_I0333 [Corymbia citriodora subsp. variegata]|nr:hypothetical protein BT93_I0333 [Corymbia citriodora subsp. variegata]